MTQQKIGIQFEVNAEELKEITSAIQVLDKFNKQSQKLTEGLKGATGAMDRAASAAKKQKDNIDNLNDVLQTVSTTIRGQSVIVNGYSASLDKVRKEIGKVGTGVKVAVDQAGKLSATFKDANDNTVKMNATFNKSTGQFEKFKTSLSAVNNEAIKTTKAVKETDAAVVKQQKALEASSKALVKVAEDYKKAHTGMKDLSHILTENKGKFDVYNNAVLKNAEITRASIDRNGKFSQTLKTLEGRLVTITGYYDKADGRITQYSQSTSKAASATERTSTAVRKLSGEMGLLDKAAAGTNKSMLSWAEALEIATTRMGQWAVAGTVIFGTQQAFKSLLGTIYELDGQMTQLLRVMDEGVDAERIFGDAIRLSTELGKSILDINEALISFSRSGFDDTEIRFLTEAVGLMSNVSDIDMGSAAESITAALTLFNVKARDAVAITNKLNEVDNQYSVSTQQLAESITKAGGAAAGMGVTMDELIGDTTAIAVATRESGKIVGNSLKAMYSRFTTNQSAIDAIEALGISITDLSGDNKSPTQILNEVAQQWDGLTKAQKANTAMGMAGTYHYNRFLALMGNYDMKLKAVNTSQKSYNSAVNENQTFMQHMQANLNLVTSAATQLAKTIGDNGLAFMMLQSLKAAATFMHGLNGIAEALGKFSFVLPVAIAGIVALTLAYKKAVVDVVALEAGLVSVNITAARTAMGLGASTVAATRFGMAVATVTAGLRAFAIAALTNPFTWIAGAVVGITMLVGHHKRLKAEQETLAAKAKDTTTAFKEFNQEIQKGEVSEVSIEQFSGKMTVAKGLVSDLTKVQKELNNTQTVSTAVQAKYGLGVAQTVNWQSKLSKEVKTSLADIGISVEKYKSLDEVIAAVNTQKSSFSSAVTRAKDALEKQRLEGILPNAEAYEAMSEAIDENASAMENALGIQDKLVKQYQEQVAVFELLSGVKNRTAQQDQFLSNAQEYLAQQLGVSTNEVGKYINKAKEQIKTDKEILDTANKMANGEAKKEEIVRAQRDLTAKNVADNAKKQKDELSKVEEAQKRAHDAQMNRLKEMDDRSNSHVSGDAKRKDAQMRKLKEMDDKYQTSGTIVEQSYSKQNKASQNNSMVYQSTSKLVKGYSNSMHTTVVSNAKSQAEEHARQISKETKSVTSGWQTMYDKVSGIIKWIKGLFGGGSSSKSTSSTSGSLKGNGIDRYAKGTSASGHRGGPAIVGERGRELAYIPGMGVTMVGQNGSELLNLPKGSSVLPNKHTEQVLKRHGFPGYAGGIGDYFDAIMKGPKAVWDAGVAKFGVSDSLIPNWFNKLTGSPVKAITSMAVDGIQSLMDKMFGAFSGAVPNITGGASAWKNMIIAAARQMGEALTEAQLNGIIAQITRESGGNQKIIQSSAVNDINMRNGNPARGLLQYIPQTFRAYAVRGHGNIYSGYDQLLAFFNNTNWRRDLPYGRRGWGPSGARKYARGGIIKQPHLGLVGEEGPEAIIPLSSEKRSRALELYEKTGRMLGVKPYASGGIVGKAPKITSHPYTHVTSISGDYSSITGTIDYLQESMIYSASNAVYDLATKARSKATGTENRRDYNDRMISILEQVDDLKTFNAWFDKASLFLPPAQMRKVKSELQKIVQENAAEKRAQQFQDALSSISRKQDLGIFTNSNASYEILKNRSVAAQGGSSAHMAYNDAQIAIFREMSNLSTFNQWFDNAKLFGTADAVAKIRENLSAIVKENAIQSLADHTQDWMNSFEESLPVVSDHLQETLSIIENINNAQKQMVNDAKVNDYVQQRKDALGLDDRTEQERLEDRYSEVGSMLDDLLNQQGQISQLVDTGAIDSQISALQAKYNEANKMLRATYDAGRAKGLWSGDMKAELDPWREQMASIQAEIDKLNKQKIDSTSIFASNEEQIASLTEEYKKLKAAMEAVNQEKKDEFGNIVRDIDGRNQTMLSSQSAIQSGSSENKVYQSDTTVSRSDTYIIQAGVTVGSQSELKEFAMLLKSLMDEEEGRSK